MKVSQPTTPKYTTTYQRGDKVYNSTKELVDSVDYLRPFEEASTDEKLMVTSTTVQNHSTPPGKAFLQSAGMGLAGAAVLGGIGALFGCGFGKEGAIIGALLGIVPSAIAAVCDFSDATQPPGEPRVTTGCLFANEDGHVALSGQLGGDPYDTVPWENIGRTKVPVLNTPAPVVNPK